MGGGRLILILLLYAASGSYWGWARHGGGRGGCRAGVHRARTARAAAAHGDQGTNPSTIACSMLILA